MTTVEALLADLPHARPPCLLKTVVRMREALLKLERWSATPFLTRLYRSWIAQETSTSVSSISGNGCLRRSSSSNFRAALVSGNLGRLGMASSRSRATRTSVASSPRYPITCQSAIHLLREMFAEQFGDVLLPYGRTQRLEHLVQHLALALGGRPAARATGTAAPLKPSRSQLQPQLSRLLRWFS